MIPCFSVRNRTDRLILTRWIQSFRNNRLGTFPVTPIILINELNCTTRVGCRIVFAAIRLVTTSTIPEVVVGGVDVVLIQLTEHPLRPAPLEIFFLLDLNFTVRFPLERMRILRLPVILNYHCSDLSL